MDDTYQFLIFHKLTAILYATITHAALEGKKQEIARLIFLASWWVSFNKFILACVLVAEERRGRRWRREERDRDGWVIPKRPSHVSTLSIWYFIRIKNLISVTYLLVHVCHNYEHECTIYKRRGKNISSGLSLIDQFMIICPSNSWSNAFEIYIYGSILI